MDTNPPPPPKPAGRRRAATARESKPDTLGWLFAIEAAELVVDQDRWWGMSDDSPIASDYELLREPSGGFAGQRHAFRRGTHEGVAEVALTAAVAKRFLHTLASAPVAPGPYEPLMDHTDDFPSVELAIHTGGDVHRGGILLLFTSSQGTFHTPWCATFRGETVTLPSNHAGRALALLRRLPRPAPRTA